MRYFKKKTRDLQLIDERVQVAVIGGGPAGMAAACSAYDAGLRNIAIIERQEELGGILQQCIHNGFGLTYYGTELTGPEYAEHLKIELWKRPRIKIKLGTFAMQLTSNRQITTMSAEGVTRWRADAVLLAMGCRERPRGAVNIPGTRPAGIFTAGTVQNLLNLQGLRPGNAAVIVGSGDIGLIMARRLTLEGIGVPAVIEIQNHPGGLTRNIVQCLHDYGIPLLLGHAVKEIRGTERVTGIVAVKLGNDGGTCFELACDTVVLSVGLLPEIELARMAGLRIDMRTGGPEINGNQQTSVPGIFACGNVAHVHDLADDASVEGEAAGRAAARFVLHGEVKAGMVPVAFSGNIRSVVPQYIDPYVDNILHIRVKQPQEQVVLRCSERVLKKYIVIRPAESLRVTIPKRTVEPDGNGRISLSLMGEDESRGVSVKHDPALMTCIVCPIGCGFKVEVEAGKVIVQGVRCKRGKEYAIAEFIAPKRILTTTVAIAGSKRLFLPVRSVEPIPKALIFEAMKELRQVVVERPVGMGQVILADVAGSKIPIVAGRSI